MPDIQSLYLALGAMTQKERDEFLGAALFQQPGASLETILLKLGLEDLAVNTKVRLVFKMGISPVAHSFRAGPERQLNWVVPVVPDHLRILVYSTSRLINEFQETLSCLQNGRGDFVKAFTLLNPENMLEMVNRFSEEMQTYTQQLRDANGRLNRFGPRGKRPSATKSADNLPQVGQAEQAPPEKAMPEAEPEQKPRKTNARTRKAQPEPEAREDASTPDASVLGAVPEGETSVTSVAVGTNTELAPERDTSGMTNLGGTVDFGGITSSALSADELTVFGFDVKVTVGEASDDTQRYESGD